MKKMYVLILLIALLLSVFQVASLAEETIIKDLVENPDNTTLIFKISWETGNLGVTLISPGGRRIPQDSLDTDVKIDKMEKYIEFRLYNPELGMWKAEFTGGGNGNVKVEFSKIVEPLKIIDIKASQIPRTNDVSLSFTSTGDRQASQYHYLVYLVIDPKDMNGRLVKDGYSSIGAQESFVLSLNDVNSYGNFYLKVNATCDTNGITDFDSALSPAFSFTNSNSLPEISHVESHFNLTDKVVAFQWEQVAEEIAIDGYRAYLFTDDAIEPFLVENLSRNETILHASIPEGAKSLRLEIMAQAAGLAGKAYIREYALESLEAPSIVLQVPKDRVFKHQNIIIPYQVKKPAALAVILNGIKTRYEVKKDGSITLNLMEDRNQVDFLIEAEEGISTAESYEFILDSTPPQLSIFEDIDGMKIANRSIVVLGNVEQSAKLLLNGEAAEFDDNGDFAIEKKLKIGKNSLTVTAQDYAGNTSEYNATVVRMIDLSQSYVVLIIGMVLSIVILVVYYVRGIKKR